MSIIANMYTFTWYDAFFKVWRDTTLDFKRFGEEGIFFEGYYYDYCLQKVNKQTINCMYTERGTCNWRKGRKNISKFIDDVNFFSEGNDCTHYCISVPNQEKDAEYPNLPKFYKEFCLNTEDEEDDEVDNYRDALEYCIENGISPYWIKEMYYGLK